MEIISASLALCRGIHRSPQGPATRSFDFFFNQRLKKRLRKNQWCRWFETPSCSVWHHLGNNFDPLMRDALESWGVVSEAWFALIWTIDGLVYWRIYMHICITRPQCFMQHASTAHGWLRWLGNNSWYVGEKGHNLSLTIIWNTDHSIIRSAYTGRVSLQK